MRAPPRWCVFFLVGVVVCRPVPFVEGWRHTLIPDQELISASFRWYQQLLDEKQSVQENPDARMVRQTGECIQIAVQRYMHANNLDSRLKGYAWQFTLFDDPSVNAFCMPGGKVGVYSGIIPVAGDAGGVAVVIGHEIAHAIADHHNERAGRVLLAHLGGGVLSEALAKEPERTRQALLAAFGLGAQVGLDFPYSSRQEDEADRLGLIFMAMAGYDPQTAVGFWRRMAATEGGAPPEFIITHPSNETRINGIQKWLPDIKRKYFRK